MQVLAQVVPFVVVVGFLFCFFKQELASLVGMPLARSMCRIFLNGYHPLSHGHTKYEPCVYEEA